MQLEDEWVCEKVLLHPGCLKTADTRQSSNFKSPPTKLGGDLMKQSRLAVHHMDTRH